MRPHRPSAIRLTVPVRRLTEWLGALVLVANLWVVAASAPTFVGGPWGDGYCHAVPADNPPPDHPPLGNPPPGNPPSGPGHKAPTDCALCPLCVARAAPGWIAAEPPEPPLPTETLVAAAVVLPPAAAPPARVRRAAQPRGPPVPV
jgi:hypothetical protein